MKGNKFPVGLSGERKIQKIEKSWRERERERKMMTPTMTSTDDDEIETQNNESNLVVKTPKLDEYKFSSHTMSLMKTATYVFLFFFSSTYPSLQ